MTLYAHGSAGKLILSHAQSTHGPEPIRLLDASKLILPASTLSSCFEATPPTYCRERLLRTLAFLRSWNLAIWCSLTSAATTLFAPGGPVRHMHILHKYSPLDYISFSVETNISTLLTFQGARSKDQNPKKTRKKKKGIENNKPLTHNERCPCRIHVMQCGTINPNLQSSTRCTDTFAVRPTPRLSMLSLYVNSSSIHSCIYLSTASCPLMHKPAPRAFRHASGACSPPSPNRRRLTIHFHFYIYIYCHEPCSFVEPCYVGSVLTKGRKKVTE